MLQFILFSNAHPPTLVLTSHLALFCDATCLVQSTLKRRPREKGVKKRNSKSWQRSPNSAHSNSRLGHKKILTSRRFPEPVIGPFQVAPPTVPWMDPALLRPWHVHPDPANRMPYQNLGHLNMSLTDCHVLQDFLPSPQRSVRSFSILVLNLNHFILIWFKI